MNIINLTPHDVHIYDAAGKNVIATYPASGTVVRVKSMTEIVGDRRRSERHRRCAVDIR